MRWAAEKIVRKCSVPGMVFGAGQAEPQRTILFFAEIARRSFVRTGGREYSNLKSPKGKNVDKDVRRGFVFALAYFFFGLLYYRTSCILGKFRFRPPAPTFSLNVGRPTQKGVSTESKVSSVVGKGHAKCTEVRMFFAGIALVLLL